VTAPFDHPDHGQPPVTELGLTDAAHVLGLSREAVRSRIRRGILSARKRNGAWVVTVTTPTTVTPPVMTTPGDHLTMGNDHPADQGEPPGEAADRPRIAPVVNGEVRRLEELVTVLREELTARRAEVERLQRQAENYQVLLLRAGAALPAGASPVAAGKGEQVGKSKASIDAFDSPKSPPRRPWWRRWGR
jgi:hypothetical protein